MQDTIKVVSFLLEKPQKAADQGCLFCGIFAPEYRIGGKIMFSELSPYLKKPALYERTHEKFWNDPHISKGMLEAHLNPNTDAASRKPEFIDSSVDWIVSLLPHGASLLDIGCGPGLYTKRFAERGLKVTGMDFSERSIAYAKEHDPKSEYIFQDYLQMEFDNKFDMVTLIWCDYGALIPEERQNLLRRIYRSLKPGGLFLFDVFTPFEQWTQGQQISWEMCEHGGFWSPSPHIYLHAYYHYGDTITVGRTVVIEDSAVHCYNIWNTCFTKESVMIDASSVGFSNAVFYSDVTGKPYTEDSHTLCAVLQKPKLTH
jgi:SAM-dependent methyltransferase